jgi:hypothetical protein
MKVEDLLLEWKKDSEINKSKLDDESIKTAMLHAKYLEIHSAVKIRYNKLRARLKDLEFEKRRWLKGTMTKEEMDDRDWDYDPWKGMSKPMKSEMDDHLFADSDVKKVVERLKDTEVLLETLESIMQNIQWRHQSIKNSIDFMKFQAGG